MELISLKTQLKKRIRMNYFNYENIIKHNGVNECYSST